MSEYFHQLAQWWGKLPTWGKVAVPVGAAGIVLLIWHPWNKSGAVQTETGSGAVGSGGSGGGGYIGGGSYGNPPPLQPLPAPTPAPITYVGTEPKPTAPNYAIVSGPSPKPAGHGSTFVKAPKRILHFVRGGKRLPPVMPDKTAGPGALSRSGAGQPAEPAAVTTTVLPRAIATPSSVVTSHAATTSRLPNTLPHAAFQQAAPNAVRQPAQVVRAEQASPATPQTRPASRTATHQAPHVVTQVNPIAAKHNQTVLRQASAANRAATAADKAVIQSLPSPLTPLSTNPIAVRQAKKLLTTASKAKVKAAAANAKAIKALPSPLRPIPTMEPVRQATRTNRVDKPAHTTTHTTTHEKQPAHHEAPPARPRMILGRH